MLRYSFAGYLNAIAMRSARTLIVEGMTDKLAMARLNQEVMKASTPKGRKLLIDTAEMLNSDGTTFENSKKVEAVHAMAIDRKVSLGALVDREFREFVFSNGRAIDTIGGHFVGPEGMFWTRGHSIENYFCDVDAIMKVLEIEAAEVMPPGFKSVLEIAIVSLIEECAALSWAAGPLGCLQKIRDMITYECWSMDGDTMALDWNEMLPRLGNRNCDAALCEALQKSYKVELQRAKTSERAVGRWCSHGAITIGAIWAGIARLLKDRGVVEAKLRAIERGSRELRFRICSDFWALRCGVGYEHSPSALIEWMGAA